MRAAFEDKENREKVSGRECHREDTQQVARTMEEGLSMFTMSNRASMSSLPTEEWSGVEWSGVEWSGVEWSGVGIRIFIGTATETATPTFVLRT
jgi:hypothetical protein